MPHDQSLDPNLTVDSPIPLAASSTLDATMGHASTDSPARTAPIPGAPDIPGYRVEGMIAKGGMGQVWSGLDLELDREVAIKTLLPGANAERFVTEAKITARLPHPGIPPVHRLGTLPDGTHYLAMKLIRGRTLADLLKERPSPNEGLSRFVQVFEQICQAVGFAHVRGVIHRDLKPLNVMVGEFGEVQVMDWGLAKDTTVAAGIESTPESRNGTIPAAESVLTRNDLTRDGAIMGTPGYMAPEQARGETVDARADVFALGSILTAILTGRPGVGGRTPREAIDQTAAGNLAEAFERLDRSGVDSELIALAKRCLSPVASDRPADGNAVAAETSAYRQGVESRLRQAETERAEALVREREQRKRRRAIQWAGGLIAGVLLAGLSVSLWQMSRATRAERLAREESAERDRQRKEADRQRETANQQRIIALANEERAEKARQQAEREKTVALAVRDFLQKRLLRQVSPWEHAKWAFARQSAQTQAKRELTVRELLDQAAREFAPDSIARKFPDQPLVQAEVLDTIGETFEGIGDYPRALTFVRAAHAIREMQFGPDHSLTLVSQANLVFVNMSAAKHADAMRIMMDLGSRLETLVRELPASSEDAASHPTALILDLVLGKMEERANPHSFRYPEVTLSLADGARLVFQLNQALPRLNRLAGQIGERFGTDDRRALMAEAWVGFCHHALGQTRKASAIYESVLGRAERVLSPDDRVLDGMREILVSTYVSLNIKEDERLRLLEQALQTKARALGYEHPSTVGTLAQLAVEYTDAGKAGKAIDLLKQARDGMTRALGPDHPDTLMLLNELASAYRDSDRLPEAIALFEQVRDARVRTQGSEHADTLTARHELAKALVDATRLEEAIKVFEQVRDARVRTLGAEARDTLSTMYALAQAYRKSERLSEAIALLERVRDVESRTLGPEHDDTLGTQNELAFTYQIAKRTTEAIQILESVRDIQMKKLGIEHDDTLATLRKLADAYGADKRWDDCIALHRRICETRVKSRGAEHRLTLAAENNLGVALKDARRLPEAIALYQKVIDVKVRTLGPENSDTLITMDNLASAHEDAGRFRDAIAIYEKIRDIRLKTQGDDHLDTLLAQETLASALRDSGKIEESIKLLEDVVKIRLKVQGAEHIATVNARAKLGRSYFDARRVPDAIKLFEQVFEARLKFYGPDHSNTLSVQTNLGLAWHALGQLEKAIALFEKVRDGRLKTSGLEHQYTLTALANLASAYRDAKRLPEAIQLFEQVLDLESKTRGADHPATATTCANLARAYEGAGRMDDALRMFERAAQGLEKHNFDYLHAASILRSVIECYEKAKRWDKSEEWRRKRLIALKKRYGENSREYFAELAGLGVLLRQQKKPREAIPLLEQARAALEKDPGPDDADTIAVVNYLAAAYHAVRDLPKAIEAFRQVADSQAKTLGADHAETLKTRNNLAAILHLAGKIPESIALLEETRDIQIKKVGPEHLDTLETLYSLAQVYRDAGKRNEAVKILEGLRISQAKTLGEDHPYTLDSHHTLAGIYRQIGRTADAIAAFEKAHSGRLKKFGADHPDTVRSAEDLAFAYYQTGKFDKAIALWEQARDARVKTDGAEDPRTLQTIRNLAGGYYSIKQFDKAIELFEKVKAAHVKQLGADHATTVLTLGNLGKVYLDCGKLDKAIEVYEQAASGLVKLEFKHINTQGILLNTIAACEAGKKLDRAEHWRRQWLALVKGQVGAGHSAYAGALAELGLNLLQQKKWKDAEPVLRECLALREKLQPDSWATFSTQSMLGEALLGQKKNADAEPLLVKGIEGMKAREKTIPAQAAMRMTEAFDRLIALYTVLEKPDEVKKWQAEKARHAETKKAPPQ